MTPNDYRERFPADAAWRLSLLGLALAVFAVVAMSSAGRIDVVDGQTRYEVGRSLADNGDSIVRNKSAWFAVFDGRNGQRYSNYRFPHSLVAAAAILVADATGPHSEIRRHFFFSLSGAVLCALIAVAYSGWFRCRGHGRLACLGWAAGGIFCTPTWYYGTTSFDEVLGTLVVLAAVLSACVLGERRPRGGAIASGLLLGLAFNCKPPLVLFMPAVVAALWKAGRPAQERWLQARIAFLSMAAGVIAYSLYDLWKFPPSTWAALAEARGEYVALWPGTPLAGLLSLLVSPGIGAIWYWPAVVIALYGLAVSLKTRINEIIDTPWGECDSPGHRLGSAPATVSDDRRFAWMVVLSATAFLAFIASIRFFSGEPAWGPRYLTPVFGVLWIFVPQGAVRLRWPKTAVLLAASLLVQIAGLTLEPMRFFTGDNLVAAEAFWKDPWTYFRFDRSQLLARPGQLWEVLSYDGPPPTTFTPAKQPTLPLFLDVKSKVKIEARNYHLLSSLRPWWISYRGLPAGERPVDIEATLVLLGWTGAFGLAAFAGSWLSGRLQCPVAKSVSSENADARFGACRERFPSP
jgi:hypothetical protein